MFVVRCITHYRHSYYVQQLYLRFEITAQHSQSLFAVTIKNVGFYANRLNKEFLASTQQSLELNPHDFTKFNMLFLWNQGFVLSCQTMGRAKFHSSQYATADEAFCTSGESVQDKSSQSWGASAHKTPQVKFENEFFPPSSLLAQCLTTRNCSSFSLILHNAMLPLWLCFLFARRHSDLYSSCILHAFVRQRGSGTE